MDKNFLKIIKIAAYTGLAAAGVFSIIKSCVEKHKKHKKEKMLLIAKQLNTEIKNTERKISPRYHTKNQEKYDELWGDNGYCNL